jgi:hypothetical protein
LRWHGYRLNNKRYVVFQALEHTLGLPAKQWRVLAEAHSRSIQQFIPRRKDSISGALCTFVVKEGGWRMSPGHVFALFRNAGGEETVVALLRVDRARFNDDLLQCTPL